MIDKIEEIKVNKSNKSIAFINNGIAFSQFGIADKILDLIINLQEENELLKNRIDKTIEYIGLNEEDLKQYDIYDVNGIELLKILRGESDE